MSHVTNLEESMETITKEGLKLKLEFKNLSVLRQALQELGTVSKSYKDYYNATLSAEIAISTKEFPRGIGFVLENGKLQPKADTFLQTKEANTLMAKIQQRYQAISLSNAFKAQGYVTSMTKNDTTEEMVLVGRKY